MADSPDEWLHIKAICALIGGTKPIHYSTYYRGVQKGLYSPMEPRGPNIKRGSRKKLEADLRRLRESETA